MRDSVALKDNEDLEIFDNRVNIATNNTAAIINLSPRNKVVKENIINGKRGYLALKRVSDCIIAAAMLIVASPILIMVAIAIKLDSKGPIIFKQDRVGKDGEIFTFYKFRSMVVDAEERLNALKDKNEMDKVAFKMKDDPRITKVGKFIRKTSLDELPQLINVINGTMRLVGPRPPLPKEVEKYNEFQKQRLMVHGGLTCYWQISGRSNIGFDDWVKLDIKYIEEMSFKTDIKILLKTVKAVLTCNGAI